MSDSLKMPETLLAAGLERAFRMGADKGAREVVRLQTIAAYLLASLEEMVELCRAMDDPAIDRARAALSKAKEGR